MNTHPSPEPTSTLVADRPRTIPLNDVADQLGLSLNATKRAIQSDTDDQLPDAIRRIPGGRVEGASYYVIRRQWESVVGAESIDPTQLIGKRRTA